MKNVSGNEKVQIELHYIHLPFSKKLVYILHYEFYYSFQNHM